MCISNWNLKILLSTSKAKVAVNLFDKVLRRGAEVLVLMYLARLVGPGSFGQFSYVSAIWIAVSAFCGMGIQNVVTRLFATRPQEEHAGIAANAIALRLGGTVLSAGLVIAICGADLSSRDTLLIVALVGAGFLAQAWDVIDYRFQTRPKYATLVACRLAVAVVALPTKTALIYLGKGVIAYCLVNAIEFGLVAMTMVVLAHRDGMRWNFGDATREGMAGLLRFSWPFIGSGLATAIYMRVDQILIASYRGLEDVGLYGAAVRIAELWYFIPIGITTIWASRLYALHAADPQRAVEEVIRVHKIIMRCTVVLVALIAFWAGPIVEIAYGRQYAAAAEVLAIYSMSGIFVVSGLVTWIWMNCEGMERYCFYQTLLGAAVSLTLNLLLIPQFGIIGAAIACVASQFSANVLFNLFNKRTRPVLALQVQGL